MTTRGTLFSSPNPSLPLAAEQQHAERQTAKLAKNPIVPRYKAFISYSHAVDGALAPAIQRALQRFAKKPLALRALTIFRDQTSLSASPALWTSIEAALVDSEYFILFASPAASASPWVAKEIGFWRQHRSSSNLLVAVTEGELFWDGERGDFDWDRSSALPVALRGFFEEEPRWVDLRWARTTDDLSLRHPQFSEAIADLAATLHGRPKDELIGEDVRQNRRAKRFAVSAATGLVVLAIAATLGGFLALVNAKRADERAQIADARRLAAQSASNLNVASDLAMLLGVESVLAHPEEPPREAISALLSAVTAESIDHRFFWEQGRDISDLAFSPNGRLLATVTSDGLLTVSEQVFENNNIEWRILSQAKANSYTQAVAINYDGSFVAWPRYDHNLNITEVEIRTPLGQIVESRLRIDGPVTDLAFHPSEPILSIAERDAQVSLWDLDKRERIGLLRHMKRLDIKRDQKLGPIRLSDDVPAWRLGFSADGKMLAAGFDDGTILVSNPKTSEVLIGPLKHQHDEESTQTVTGLVFANDDRVVISAGADGFIRRWDTATGEPIGDPVRADDDMVWDLELGPEAGILASSGSTGVYFWRPWDLSPLPGRLRGKSTSIGSIAFSPDQTLLASGSPLTIWHLRRELLIAASERVHASRVNVVAASAVGSRIVSGGMDGKIQLWDWHDEHANRDVLISNADSPVVSLSLSEDARNLAAARGDGIVEFWDIASRRVVRSFSVPDVNEIEWGRGGHVAAAGTRLGKIILLDPVEGVRTSAAHADQGPIDSLVFSPDGKIIASTSVWDRSVRLWNATTLESLGEPLRISATRIRFSPDGNLLALGSVSGNVQLLDMRRSGEESWQGVSLTDQSRMGKAVTGLVFSPDGKAITAGGQDGNISLWDVDSGELFGSIPISTYQIWSLAIDSSGKMLAIARDDGVVTFLDMRVQYWAEAGCRMVNRELTIEEWRRYISKERPYQQTCDPHRRRSIAIAAKSAG